MPTEATADKSKRQSRRPPDPLSRRPLHCRVKERFGKVASSWLCQSIKHFTRLIVRRKTVVAWTVAYG
jgi:hypothetical protein